MKTVHGPRPMRESGIWPAMANFYQAVALDAWSDGHVPFGMSTNPALARSYSRLIVAHLRDLRDAGALDSSRPFLVLDLGSGSGRMTFHLALALREAAERLPWMPRVCVVLTDISQANLDALKAHPQLAPLMAEGFVDAAWMDAVNPGGLTLQVSGQTIEEGTPLIAIANYFFDTICQDAFMVYEGALKEILVTVSVDDDTEFDDPFLLADAKLTYSSGPVQPQHYGEPVLDAVLDSYRGEPGKWVLLFPLIGIRLAHHLAAFSGDQFLLLIGDKARLTLEGLKTTRTVHFAKHGGAMSMTVNMHAIGQALLSRGGFAMVPPHFRSSFSISAVGVAPGSRSELAHAFAAVSDDNPRAFRRIWRKILSKEPELSPEERVDLLALSGWDQDMLRRGGKPLLKGLVANDAARERLLAGYFPINDDLERVMEYLGGLGEE